MQAVKVTQAISTLSMSGNLVSLVISGIVLWLEEEIQSSNQISMIRTNVYHRRWNSLTNGIALCYPLSSSGSACWCKMLLPETDCYLWHNISQPSLIKLHTPDISPLLILLWYTYFLRIFFFSVNLCQANNRCAELSGDSCFSDEFYLQIFFYFPLFEFLRGSGQCYGREIITSFDWFCNWIKVEMSVVIESRQNCIFSWAITRVHIWHQSSFFSLHFFWIEWRRKGKKKEPYLF